MLSQKMIGVVLVVCLIMFGIGSSYGASTGAKVGWITGGFLGYSLIGGSVGNIFERHNDSIPAGTIGVWVGAGIGIYLGIRAPDSRRAKDLILASPVVVLILLLEATTAALDNEPTLYLDNRTIKMKIKASKIPSIDALGTMPSTSRVIFSPPSVSIQDSIQLPNHITETDVTMRLVNIRF